MLRVEQVDGLDVTEDGGDHVLAEHVLGPVLSVHAEVEHLQSSLYQTPEARLHYNKIDGRRRECEVLILVRSDIWRGERDHKRLEGSISMIAESCISLLITN